jgi:hypothetical protein
MYNVEKYKLLLECFQAVFKSFLFARKLFLNERLNWKKVKTKKNISKISLERIQ